MFSSEPYRLTTRNRWSIFHVYKSAGIQAWGETVLGMLTGKEE
jgi:hypothetical protein